MRLIKEWGVDLWVGFWLAFVFLASCLAPEPVRGDDHSSDQLWLARICVHEATWAGGEASNDCGALLQTLRNQDRGDVRRTLSIYSRRFYNGVSPRAWTRLLTAEMTLRTWPGAGGSFANNYPRWRSVYERAGRYVRGEEELPCEGTPYHWGARYGVDRERAQRAIQAGRWREVSCGETRNAFYEVLRRQDT